MPPLWIASNVEATLVTDEDAITSRSKVPEVEIRVEEACLISNLNTTEEKSGRCNGQSAAFVSSTTTTATLFKSSSLSARAVDEDGGDSDSVNSSTSSTAYFEPSDLNPGYWINVMGNHAPTVAISVVALTAVITHPLMFAVGALAAWGSFTVVGAGYDYFTACADPTTTIIANEDTTTTAKQMSSSQTVSQSSFSGDVQQSFSALFCWYTPVVEEEDNPPLLLHSTVTDSEQEDEAEPIISDTLDAVADLTQVLVPNVTVLDEGTHAPQARPTNKTKDEEETANIEHFVVGNYPPLDHLCIDDEVFPGLSALEVFNIFFADDAPYNFKEFQNKRGDLEINYQPWKDLDQSSSPLFERNLPVSFQNIAASSQSSDADSNPNASETPPPFPPLASKERVMTFKAKTNAMFGPAYASTTKTQRVFIFNKRWVVMEGKTQLSDILFSDRFVVVERWVLRVDKKRLKQPSSSAPPPAAAEATISKVTSTYNCRVSASCRVIFRKSCGATWEHQIRNRCHSILKDVAAAWCRSALEALQLAEAAKICRLKSPPIDPDHANHPNGMDEDSAGNDKEATVSLETLPIDESVEIETDCDPKGVITTLTLRQPRSESDSLEWVLTQPHPYLSPPYYQPRQSILPYIHIHKPLSFDTVLRKQRKPSDIIPAVMSSYRQ